jgi:hypothetical protein
LFASAVANRDYILTNDRRALIAAAGDADLASAISGKVATLPCTILLLCNEHGNDFIKDHFIQLKEIDTIIKVVVASENPSEVAKYYRDELSKQLGSLQLWNFT